ncbi:hypothetical protein JKP88DRAFT_167140 [Tribonema minus]|uniref:Alpha/beta hydrolase n=1 Tax=Tribonema minus TaxID=303371 RepID=A0A836CCI5_9STRA|nr:hypothetical protein JKP88DRAFT_167140 [Tribonema minus]
MTASPATRSAADPTSPPVAAPPYAYAYCHGFLSYPRSTKGVHVRKELQHLADIELLDLNLPDGSGVVTYASGLAAIERFLEQQRLLHGHGVKLRLIGSSLGGYIVARFAELHPEAVDRIFMLCPAFSIGERASKFLPPEEMAEWERDGVRGEL